MSEAIVKADGTVFISYARADDEKPPFEESVHGWVEFFWHQLRFELNNAGVAQARLWKDRYEIEPAEDFTQKIEQALQESRLIIPVLSPNWVQREWCLRELQRFRELKGEPGANDNIALVVKRETPGDLIPEALRNREGYRFFLKEPSGRVKEFYWRGLQDREAYLDVLRRMADWIAARLLVQLRRIEPVQPEKKPGRVIFLALSEELKDARQLLANDLRGAGFTVLPEEGHAPATQEEAEQWLRAMLRQAEIAVHPLGTPPGEAVDSGGEWLTTLQLRLSRERQEAKSGLLRVLWAPKWLSRDRERKRDPFEVVRQFGDDPASGEVYGEMPTNLSQWLRKRLDSEPDAGRDRRPPTKLLVTAAAEADEELVSDLAGRLQGERVAVLPLFCGDPVPNAGPKEMLAAIVLWGESSGARLNALVDALLPVVDRVTVLKLPGGDEGAKRRFFREGVVVEKIGGLPEHRQGTRALLTQLDLLDPA